jgi:cyclopropane-fatty-acyl-phospholipid synthase
MLHLAKRKFLSVNNRFPSLVKARGMPQQDQKVFVQHYAETLRRWRKCFDTAIEGGRLPQASIINS